MPLPNPPAASAHRVGMVGMGMIFDETYRAFFETVDRRPLYDPSFGVCRVALGAVASRTGRRAEAYRRQAPPSVGSFESFDGPNAVDRLLKSDIDIVCVATPDDRHFDAAKVALQAGKHLLVEKPSVLKLNELDELHRLAQERGVLAKVVYHKLLDPDHKKLRTLCADGVLRHVNNGYCSLLEPKAIAGSQFAEWITGRNPGTYVAVHYIKLIDFTFGLKLKRVACTGQRGIVAAADGPTWDSTQLRLVYEHPDGREAAFDIHTSWVTPDNFPGYVEQEVQFRFDNGVWNGHSRKRGVECTVEDLTPHKLKNTLNNHYNASVLEPWGERAQRGYGVEVIERFMREAATVEFGGPAHERNQRLEAARALAYNDVSADRQVVAAVEAMEAILARHAAGTPDCVVHVNNAAGGLVLCSPGSSELEVLYAPAV
jgi:D-galacturonate reductase